MTSAEVLIRIQATPNPNAWKFVLDRPVLNEGKATYSSIQEAEHNILSRSLFEIEGVRQVHFFQNVITVTHQFDTDSEKLQKETCAVIQTRMSVHNPNQTVLDEKKIARQNLSPELQQIEEILDRTIRPGLQGDGGDLLDRLVEGGLVHLRGVSHSAQLPNVLERRGLDLLPGSRGLEVMQRLDVSAHGV